MYIFKPLKFFLLIKFNRIPCEKHNVEQFFGDLQKHNFEGFRFFPRVHLKYVLVDKDVGIRYKNRHSNERNGRPLKTRIIENIVHYYIGCGWRFVCKSKSILSTTVQKSAWAYFERLVWGLKSLLSDQSITHFSNYNGKYFWCFSIGSYEL